MTKHLFTSESVTEGHPDKICDRISDSVLDAIFEKDPNARVACETAITTNQVLIMGEISTTCSPDIEAIARKAICDIGYDSPEKGFDGNTCKVIVTLDKQSGDIAMGVDKSLELKDGEEDRYNLNGAGDQGMMFGYAEGDATTNYLPVPICYAQALMLEFQWRRQFTDKWAMENLRPDAKCQITYDEDSGKIRTIVISHQHVDSMYFGDFINHARMAIRMAIPENLILPLEFLNHDDKYSLLEDKTFVFLNPTGRFVEGGPSADTGLSGRKIVVDTYGGVGKIGGGAFSGKDPSKVDRSAAYMCRYVAKNLVASGKCRKAEVSVAYAIGVAEPVQVSVDTFGTGNDAELTEYVKQKYDFRPKAIIEMLGLRNPEGWCYRGTARNGHFTNCSFPWEKIC